MPRPSARSILFAPLRGLKALGEAIFSTPNPWATIAGTSPEVARRVGDGASNSIVVAALGWLQRNFVQATLRVRVPGDDGQTLTPIVAGDRGAARMLTLLEDPNPFYDWGALAKASILSERVSGEFFWLVVRGTLNMPVQYWWIPHTLIEPKRREGSNEFITHYEYSPGNGVPVELAREDVVHHRNGLDPVNPMRGMSQLKSVLREVYTDEEAAAYTSTLLVNMGVPGIIVSPEAGPNGVINSPSADDIAETKQKLEQMTTGSNRGRAVVMSGPTKLNTVGFSPEQMNLRELRRIPEERITAALGVPAIVAGMGAGLDRSTFSNMSEAREAATEEALIPLWNDFARTIKKQVLPEFEGTRAAGMTVDFDLSTVRVLREDEDKKVDRALRLVAGGVGKVAEAREAAGLPVEDEHDIYLRPLGVLEVPAGVSLEDREALTAAVEPAKELVKAGRVLSGANASAIADALAQLRAVLERAGVDLDEVEPKHRSWQWLWAPGRHVDSTKGKLPRRAQAQLIQKLDRDARSLEARFAKQLEETFEDLGRHVAAAWAKETGGKALDADDAAAVKRTLTRANVASWRKTKFDNAYQAHYQGVVDQSIDTVSATLGIEIGAVDRVSVDVLREGGTRAGLVDLEKQTRESLISAVADAREATLGPVDIERQIRQYVTNGGPSANVSARAMRIARTETMHAQRVSTRSAYAASGAFATVIAWDDRLGYGDEDCSARNGQEFTFEEAEAEEAEEHPNGTLSWAPGSTRE